jgi:hypothetical protein
MAEHTDPFPASALADNRSGRLSAEQRPRFQNMVRERRGGARRLAVPVGAIAVLLLVLSGPEATSAKRHLAGLGFAAAAAAILIAPAFDPLAADVRDGRVAVVDGAIAKRRVQSRRPSGARYYLDIAGRHLLTYPAASDAAPDAGYVRAYFLPRTHHLVNLERLANPALPSDPDAVRDLFRGMGRALASHDSVAFAEARAKAASLTEAVRESMVQESAPPAGSAGRGLAREALVGRWINPLVTVTLRQDGTATVAMIAGARRDGHWAIDAEGRLLTDATGKMEPTSAWLDDDGLTIQLEGRRLKFTRASGG